jgi:hypothetical protein
VRSPHGDVCGFVSTSRAVRDPTGSIAGTLDEASGTFCDMTGARVAILCAPAGVITAADGRLVGFVQGLPPPLLLVHRACPSGSPEGEHVGIISWATQLAVLSSGENIGTLGPGGKLLGPSGTPDSRYVVSQTPGPPLPGLPQTVDFSGTFLGYVLPSGAVVSTSGITHGTVMPDGLVVSPALHPLGTFNTAGFTHSVAIPGAAGRPLGFLQADGRVLPLSGGPPAGLLTADRRVLHPSGAYVGAATPQLGCAMRAKDDTTFSISGRNTASVHEGSIGQEARLRLTQETIAMVDPSCVAQSESGRVATGVAVATRPACKVRHALLPSAILKRASCHVS